MKTVIEDAIKDLAGKAKKEKDSGDAMRFSQAALNLAHAYATFEGGKKDSRNSQ